MCPKKLKFLGVILSNLLDVKPAEVLKQQLGSQRV